MKPSAPGRCPIDGKVNPNPLDLRKEDPESTHPRFDVTRVVCPVSNYTYTTTTFTRQYSLSAYPEIVTKT